MPTPNYNLLKDAYAVIDGIPAEAIDLDSWRLRTGESLGCDTIACAAGWLALHPEFKALGLIAHSGGTPNFRQDSGNSALEKFFRLSYKQTERLFGPAFLEHPSRHKYIFLKRLRNFLVDAGQL